METILLHRLGHPTVDAAQRILAFLDMQLHESLIHQITTVLSPCMRLLDTRILYILFIFWCKGTTFCLIFHDIIYFLILIFSFSYYFV